MLFPVRWPGKMPAGLVSDACLNTSDIMPTLLSMAGLKIQSKIEGMDLSHGAEHQRVCDLGGRLRVACA